ncbi:MAG: hypothetical protein IPN18_11535 [Ignavibacteriales bacterium]|nr:hypothetical protein [Ignavibacteriales bacterium]
MSVITDEQFFKGASIIFTISLLIKTNRSWKDFIIDESQVFQARENGLMRSC